MSSVIVRLTTISLTPQIYTRRAGASTGDATSLEGGTPAQERTQTPPKGETRERVFVGANELL